MDRQCQHGTVEPGLRVCHPRARSVLLGLKANQVCYCGTPDLSLERQVSLFFLSPWGRDRPYQQQYLELGDFEDWPFNAPDRVLMFSGGLDSLAGAVETAKRGQNSILVSHRPVTTMRRPSDSALW